MDLKVIRFVAHADGRGVEAELRALKEIRRAVRPMYASVFVPLSNQPGGKEFAAYTS